METRRESRVELLGGISGFVVAEDVSLQAQLSRKLEAYRQVLKQAAPQPRPAVDAPLHHAASLKPSQPAAAQLDIAGLAKAFLLLVLKALLRPFAPLLRLTHHVTELPAWRNTASFITRIAMLCGLLLHILFPSLGFNQHWSEDAKSRRFFVITAFMLLAMALILPAMQSPAPAAVSNAVPAVEAVVLPAMPETPGFSPDDPNAEPQAAPQRALAAAVAEPVWQPVRRPILMFNLEAPELEGTMPSYKVATRGNAARQDSLTWISEAEDGKPALPLIHLLLERFEAEALPARPFFSDLAALAANAQFSLERMASPAEINTKFGIVQVADATLSHEGRSHACLAFRRLDPIGLHIRGWTCAHSGKVIDRVGLGCFLNRLDLVSAGTDVALKRYFAQAERSRLACASTRQPSRKVTWMDHDANLPNLKLSTRLR